MKPVEPYRRFDRNEGTTIMLELTHLDKDKALATPSTLQYRIDDLTNNREVLDWTSVSTPGSTNTITITAAQNALYSRNQPREMRQVTTKTIDASGNADKQPHIYTLIRLHDREDQL